MVETERPKTQPRLVAVPTESPSPEETSLQEQLAAIIQPKSATEAQKIQLSPEVVQLLNTAYKALPPGWLKMVIKENPKMVVFLISTCLLPLLLTTWNSVKGLVNEPFNRLDRLEEIQKKQSDQLNRIEALLQGPTSKPR